MLMGLTLASAASKVWRGVLSTTLSFGVLLSKWHFVGHTCKCIYFEGYIGKGLSMMREMDY